MARRNALAAALALAVAAATWAFVRSRGGETPSPDVSGPRTTAPPALASKAFYRVDAAPPPTCAVGAPCEVRFVLSALGAYHVNRAYPFKFIADPPPAAALDGAAVFRIDGEAPGDDPGANAHRGSLTVRFRPSTAGTARVAGTFKLSVCSDDTCEIEAPRLAVEVAVR